MAEVVGSDQEGSVDLKPVYNAPVPFRTIIGGLFPNKKICVSGVANEDPTRITVDLLDSKNEIAMHFDIRFKYLGDTNGIVRNSTKNLSWQREERELKYFPFKGNEFFEITTSILAEPLCFKVAVNNQHLLDFQHRLFPLDQFNTLEMRGDVRHTQVKLEAPEPVYNMPVPFIHRMGALSYPVKKIIIGGIPHPNTKRFTFNLEKNESYIALHFDVRFPNEIVRNSHDSRGWGREERELPFFPFQPDTFFELIFLVEPLCFKVTVNDQHLLEYQHRFQPLTHFDTLRITGDVRLTHVRFQD